MEMSQESINTLNSYYNNKNYWWKIYQNEKRKYNEYYSYHSKLNETRAQVDIARSNLTFANEKFQEGYKGDGKIKGAIMIEEKINSLQQIINELDNMGTKVMEERQKIETNMNDAYFEYERWDNEINLYKSYMGLT